MGQSSTNRRRARTEAERLDALDGAHRLPSGKIHCRMSFPGIGRLRQTVDTVDAAEDLLHEWARAARNGWHPLMTDAADWTLGHAATLRYELRRDTPSERTGRPLAPASLRAIEFATRPWRTGPLAGVPLRYLDRGRIEDDYRRRRTAAPKIANDELAALKDILVWAQSRRQTVPPEVLTIPAVRIVHDDPSALTPAELVLFAAAFPPYMRRHVLFVGQVGLRITESFTLEDHRIDWHATDADGTAMATVTIPAHLCKEHRTKTIDLLPDEAMILAEQVGRLHAVDPDSQTASLPARAAGTTLVFPTKTGRPWRYSDYRRYWDKARTRAAASWRESHDLPADAETPFDHVTPHKLRSTAATMLRDADVSAEATAHRLGHKDTGGLVSAVYDAGVKQTRTRRAITARVDGGLLRGAGKTPSGAPQSDAPNGTRKATR